MLPIVPSSAQHADKLRGAVLAGACTILLAEQAAWRPVSFIRLFDGAHYAPALRATRLMIVSRAAA